MIEHDTRLAENAAAISASFHQSPLYEAAYTRAKDAVGGFPGLWKVCARLAVLVTEQEVYEVLNFDSGSPDWISFVDDVATLLAEYLRDSGQAPDDLKLAAMIAAAAGMS